MSADVIPSPGATLEADGGFSVVYGGPMMRLMARIGFENPRRRAIGIVLVTWGGCSSLSAMTALFVAEAS